MKHVEVQFNTRTHGVKSSTKELRRRYVNSEGFKRLLHAAADAQLKNHRVTLRASNPKALRALERAVSGVRRTMELDTQGHAARPAYLMKGGKTWTEVHKASAVRAMKATTPDTLAVMKVWTFSPTISHRAAARLVAKTAPDSINSLLEDAAVIAFKEDRGRATDKRGDNAQTEAAELAPWEEEAAEYNDAGELETLAERQEREQREREAREKKGIRIARERARAAGKVFIPPTPRRTTPKPAPRFHEFIHVWERPQPPAPTPVAHELPAAPYYHATEAKMEKSAQEELSAERKAYRERRAELDDDENERLLCAELGESLADDEDLEAGMLEPWEAMERYAAAQ